MKKQLIKLIGISLLVSLPTIFSVAQPNPGQNSGGGPLSGGPIGGSAPVGGGLVIMLVLSAAYAGKKAYNFKREKDA